MLVAVYGTLKRGYGNHRLLEGATFVEEDIVTGYDLTFSYGVGSFPVAMEGSGDVLVEVFDIGDDDVILSRLDALEGVPHMYTREEVVTNDARKVNMYVGNPDCFSHEMIPVPLNSDGIFEWRRAYG